MFAIKTSCFRIRVEKSCLVVVDTKLITVVGSIVDPRPPQVLRHASRVSPPVRQTQLHVNVVLRRFRDHFVEMHERVFVPLSWSKSKGMISWPVFKIGHRLDVVWTTLAECPYSHDLDAELCRLSKCFRHAFAILIAIHDGYVGANKPKWFLTDKEATASLPNELSLRAVSCGI
jgi:hypothetical protein